MRQSLHLKRKGCVLWYHVFIVQGGRWFGPFCHKPLRTSQVPKIVSSASQRVKPMNQWKE